MSTRQTFRSFRIESHGSRRARTARRLRRIGPLDRWPVEMWIVVIAMIALVLLAPRMAELHHEMHHPKADKR
jgi:hypothetical protein